MEDSGNILATYQTTIQGRVMSIGGRLNAHTMAIRKERDEKV